MLIGDRRDRMVVGYTNILMQSVPITTGVVNSNPAHAIYNIIQFVSDMRQLLLPFISKPPLVYYRK